MAQITGILSNDLLSEVALRCGDPLFKDFKKNIYNQAVYRANRIISRKYQLLERRWLHTVTTDEAVDATEIVIPQLNFDAEYKFIVTPTDGSAVDFNKVNNELSGDINDYQYYIRYYVNQYVLNYQPKVEGDIINLYYIAGISGVEDYEELDAEGNTNIIPVLPQKYDEEVIRQSVIYMAHIGIASFDAEKSVKYKTLLQINSKQDFDPTLAKNSQWVTVKPYKWWE